MMCSKCPAYCKISYFRGHGFTGCLVLGHGTHPNYDGCSLSKDEIMAELNEWLKNATEYELEQVVFWKVCQNSLDSHWITAKKLRDELKEK